MQANLLFATLQPKETTLLPKGGTASDSHAQPGGSAPDASRANQRETPFADRLNAAHSASKRQSDKPAKTPEGPDSGAKLDVTGSRPKTVEPGETDGCDPVDTMPVACRMPIALEQVDAGRPDQAHGCSRLADHPVDGQMRVHVDSQTRLFVATPLTDEPAAPNAGDPTSMIDGGNETGIRPQSVMATKIAASQQQLENSVTRAEISKDNTAATFKAVESPPVHQDPDPRNVTARNPATALTSAADHTVGQAPTVDTVAANASRTTESLSHPAEPARIPEPATDNPPTEDRHPKTTPIASTSKTDDTVGDDLRNLGKREPIINGQLQNQKGAFQETDDQHRQQNSMMHSHPSSATVEEAASTAKDAEGSPRPTRGEVIHQIVDKAVMSLKNGQSQVRIDLKPEYMGHVRMQIATDQQQVTLRIMTELPVVKELIESHISQLKTDLQQHGLQIDELEVFVAHDRDRQNHQARHPAASRSRRRSAATGIVDEAGEPGPGQGVAHRVRLDENSIDFFV